jgi:heme A synthase
MANHALLATVLATSQVLYVANTTTFGCSSIQEIAKLQLIRTVTKAFQAELYEQIFEGQCVEIPKGKLVEGSIEPGDSSMLLVDRRIEPPGFVAPLHDFHKLKEPSGGK